VRKARYTKLPIKIKRRRQKGTLWSNVRKTTAILLLFFVLFAAAYGLFRGYKFIISSEIFKVNVKCINLPKDIESKYLEVIDIICGDNFFLFSGEKLKKNLTSTFTEIKDVKVKKVFPNKVYLEFIFREPIGNIVVHNITKCIDENGVIFETIHSTGLPEVSSHGDKKEICNLLFWLKCKHPAFYQNIKKAVNHENRYISFILQDGSEVLWSDEDKNLRESKILAYNLVMKKIESDAATSSSSASKTPKRIDLRYYPNGDIPVRFFNK